MDAGEPGPWIDRLLGPQRAAETDRSFLVCANDDGAIAGVIEPVADRAWGRSAAPTSATTRSSRTPGAGYMRAAMPLLLRQAFDELGLHRVQANIQPENERLDRARAWRRGSAGRATRRGT